MIIKYGGMVMHKRFLMVITSRYCLSEELQGIGNEVLHDWALYKKNIKTNKYNQFTGFMRLRFDGSRAT